MREGNSALELDELGGGTTDGSMPAPSEASDAGRNEDPQPIPRPILFAIASAACDSRIFEVARGLCAEDVGGLNDDDNIAEGRLERAIARALLDLWTRGHGSAEAVGSAYALAADGVARRMP